MTVERTVVRTLHLQRTSEADEVPVEWAKGAVDYALGPLTAQQRSTARLCGWRGLSIEFDDVMGEAEFAEARRRELADTMRAAMADGVINADEWAAIAQLIAPGA